MMSREELNAWERWQAEATPARVRAAFAAERRRFERRQRHPVGPWVGERRAGEDRRGGDS
jgi:hypothetical protein